MADWRVRTLELLDTRPSGLDPAELETLRPLLSAMGMRPFDEVKGPLESGLAAVLGAPLAGALLDGALHVEEVIQRVERVSAWAALKDVGGKRATTPAENVPS